MVNGECLMVNLKRHFRKFFFPKQANEIFRVCKKSGFSEKTDFSENAIPENL